jgi:hypothetical protein
VTMNELAKLAVEAQGGLDHWKRFTTLDGARSTGHWPALRFKPMTPRVRRSGEYPPDDRDSSSRASCGCLRAHGARQRIVSHGVLTTNGGAA